MNVVDANVLIYAVDEASDRHAESVGWIDWALSGNAAVGFSWVAMLAFVRLTTKPQIFASPLSSSEALDRVDAWLASPAAIVVEPTSRHTTIVRELLAGTHRSGNLVNDAHLAALAIEHRGCVVSYDSDFGRFPGVDWTTPGPG